MTETTILKGVPELPGDDSVFPKQLASRFIGGFRDFIIRIAVAGGSILDTRERLDDVESGNRGRCVRYERTESAALVEPFPTIKAMIRSGRGLPLVPLPKTHWTRSVRKARPRVTAMLVIDASRSSNKYLIGLSEVLSVLFKNLLDTKSKIGMVAIRDSMAELIFAPTTNRLRVLGRMKELKSGGYTPLDEALKKARQEMVRYCRNDRTARPFILLVSDCYPEPLPLEVSDPYEHAKYKDVRREARLIGDAKIPIAIIDPSSAPPVVKEGLPGRRLARYIAKATGGVFIPIPAEKMRTGGLMTPGFIADEMKKSEAAKIARQLDGINRIMRHSEDSRRII